jgi:hypothetical protein
MERPVVDRSHCQPGRVAARHAVLPIARLMKHVRWAIASAMTMLGGTATTAFAQCFPPTNTNEALLLAHYEAPVTFATADVPTVLPFGGLALTGEVVGVPAPSAAITHTSYCYVSKQENTHLSPVLPRLRLTVGLPAGFAVEGSYLPPITVDHAQPNLGSLALTYTRAVFTPPASGLTVLAAGRLDGTLGRIVGPITCPASALQTTDASEPCYGTKESSDAFYPNALDAEATVGAVTRSRFGAFVGGGYQWLAPHFRVGFGDLEGVNHTLVEVDLHRVAVFGGISVPIVHALDAAAEVYSVPKDLTTWRLSARYRLF